MELSVLCDVKVFLCVFDHSNTKFIQYISHNINEFNSLFLSGKAQSEKFDNADVKFPKISLFSTKNSSEKLKLMTKTKAFL